jgi:O-antigen/teichoic acid export membrane protein
MLAAKAEPTAVTADQQRASFFRQSGFLMIANIAGGVFMWAVHLLTKAIPPEEYAIFGTLLTVVMLLPTIPTQMVVAEQTAKGLAINRLAELSGILRWFCKLIFFLWLAFAVIVLVFQNWIVQKWQLPNATGLWVLLPVILLQLWLPLFWGALQGKQNFLWLGSSMMLNGVGRLSAAAFAVLVFHFYAVGMISGVLFGLLAATAIAFWHARSLFLAPPANFDWKSVVKQVFPLMLGFFGFQFLFTADTLFVKAYFSPALTGFYLSAGTLSRALMWLVGPMATVMFPRLVHSAAKSEKSNLTALVLAATFVLAAMGAISLSILGPWVVKFVFKPNYVKAASAFLPWYSWAMVPLAMANVLLNDLLVRPASRKNTAICVFILAVAYGFALTQFHSSPKAVLQVLLVFNSLFFLSCYLFWWKSRKTTDR